MMSGYQRMGLAVWHKKTEREGGIEKCEDGGGATPAAMATGSDERQGMFRREVALRRSGAG